MELGARSCPLCLSNRISLFLAKKINRSGNKPLLITTNDFGDFTNIWKCYCCGFIFENVLPGELENAYVSSIDTEYLAEEEGRRKTAIRILTVIETYVQQGNFLDVGCFTGLLLSVARDRGWWVHGIEPSHWAAKIALDRNLNVIQGSLETADVPISHFDVVTLIDVIEHLPYPLAALRKINKLLGDKGFVYISTPNVSSVTAKVLGRRWWSYRFEHVNYFNIRTLCRALNDSGFDIVLSWKRGRDFTLRYWLSKIMPLSSGGGKLISDILNHLKIDRRLVYLDLGDQIDVLARKR